MTRFAGYSHQISIEALAAQLAYCRCRDPYLASSWYLCWTCFIPSSGSKGHLPHCPAVYGGNLVRTLKLRHSSQRLSVYTCHALGQERPATNDQAYQPYTHLTLESLSSATTTQTNINEAGGYLSTQFCQVSLQLTRWDLECLPVCAQDFRGCRGADSDQGVLNIGALKDDTSREALLTRGR